MSECRVYQAEGGELLQTERDQQKISALLATINVQFEAWQHVELPNDISQETILDAYQTPIDRLKQQYSFQSVDVVSLQPDHPDREMLRARFIVEHTHSEFEIRFFIQGRGLFYIHQADKVYGVLCEQGDLISVPADTRHWFDMGPKPDFKCIRLFSTVEDWEANYTGDDIAERFPQLDELCAV